MSQNYSTAATAELCAGEEAPLLAVRGGLQDEQGGVGARQTRRLGQLGQEELAVAPHLRPRVLRRRDDAHCGPQIRHGQIRRRVQVRSSEAESISLVFTK